MAAWLPLPSGFTGYATRFVVSLFSKNNCHLVTWDLGVLGRLNSRPLLHISREPKYFIAQLLAHLRIFT
jgi:hypothetical protein